MCLMKEEDFIRKQEGTFRKIRSKAIKSPLTKRKSPTVTHNPICKNGKVFVVFYN